jgi:hypothetical protein
VNGVCENGCPLLRVKNLKNKYHFSGSLCAAIVMNDGNGINPPACFDNGKNEINFCRRWQTKKL